ncbi:hypothetical protein A1O7_03413 [Cladophialophora yegresii CBS 114405]|uniref:Uncharacterized protein n=1 Tax=Cladophialophora yegresii CBS 114405 TaxID=1182544 RepID=W9WXH8_9EURO|nr:uncharacterized protein A1O7_03413 [Cladophialophora yegresii CBS 114405]EXJ62969.1 hypothetical protein A1O7_03413 [Cladophialophora yegresii CBS 114405]
MQIAAFLSDLKSLTICSHEAATALVKPPAPTGAEETETTATEKAEDVQAHSSGRDTRGDDQDLQRANELLSLHYGVKLKYLETGPDPELEQAGRAVDEVLASLRTSR